MLGWNDSVLYRNRFTGFIPKEIGRLKMLELLDLRNNNLSGRIPAEIRMMPSLKHLWVHCYDFYLFSVNWLQIPSNWTKFSIFFPGWFLAIKLFLPSMRSLIYSQNHNLMKTWFLGIKLFLPSLWSLICSQNYNLMKTLHLPQGQEGIV